MQDSEECGPCPVYFYLEANTHTFPCLLITSYTSNWWQFRYKNMNIILVFTDLQNYHGVLLKMDLTSAYKGSKHVCRTNMAYFFSMHLHCDNGWASSEAYRTHLVPMAQIDAAPCGGWVCAQEAPLKKYMDVSSLPLLLHPCTQYVGTQFPYVWCPGLPAWKRHFLEPRSPLPANRSCWSPSSEGEPRSLLLQVDLGFKSEQKPRSTLLEEKRQPLSCNYHAINLSCKQE